MAWHWLTTQNAALVRTYASVLTWVKLGLNRVGRRYTEKLGCAGIIPFRWGHMAVPKIHPSYIYQAKFDRSTSKGVGLTR